jgi:hypothetical protein
MTFIVDSPTNTTQTYFQSYIGPIMDIWLLDHLSHLHFVYIQFISLKHDISTLVCHILHSHIFHIVNAHILFMI